jgi:hypothetical protein
MRCKAKWALALVSDRECALFFFSTHRQMTKDETLLDDSNDDDGTVGSDCDVIVVITINKPRGNTDAIQKIE